MAVVLVADFSPGHLKYRSHAMLHGRLHGRDGAVYGCSICGVDCGSQPRLQQHLAGRKHRLAAVATGGSADTALSASAAEPPQPEPDSAISAAGQPATSAIAVELTGSVAAAVVAGLAPLVSAPRLLSLRKAAALRCGMLHLAFENVFKNDNCAHALRTAECAGIHNVHLIRGPQALESKRGGSLKRVDNALSKSADRWLKLHYHSDTAAFIQWLHANDCSLYGAHYDPSASPIAECDFAPRGGDNDGGGTSCVVFGNERDGMSPALQAACDSLFFLPSVGLTKSYNVAAACAMTIYHLHTVRRVKPDRTPAQQVDLLASWLLGDSFVLAGEASRGRVEAALSKQNDLTAEAVQGLLRQELAKVAPFESKHVKPVV